LVVPIVLELHYTNFPKIVSNHLKEDSLPSSSPSLYKYYLVDLSTHTLPPTHPHHMGDLTPLYLWGLPSPIWTHPPRAGISKLSYLSSALLMKGVCFSCMSFYVLYRFISVKLVQPSLTTNGCKRMALYNDFSGPRASCYGQMRKKSLVVWLILNEGLKWFFSKQIQKFIWGFEVVLLQTDPEVHWRVWSASSPNRSGSSWMNSGHKARCCWDSH